MKILVLLLVVVAATSALRSPFRLNAFDKVRNMIQNGVDPGKPLFLTPYIKSGDIETAHRMSEVGPLKGWTGKSYSGYFTVNEKYNSNMFFWFFPAAEGASTAPVVLWLQGGPGGTSLFGLFVESGPIFVTKDNQLHPRNITWASKYNMLYIDNPVGTGFSFTDDDAGYARDETMVASDLYSCLSQFFMVFKEFQKNDFYATGESYAGKYVPAITYKIHSENQATPKVHINLKGMAIGDGLIDPESMVLSYADFMYNTGLIDANQAKVIYNMSANCVVAIQRGDFMGAFKIFDAMLNGDFTKPSMFTKFSGMNFYFNFLLTEEPPSFEYYNNYVALPEVRRAIHVGNLTFHTGNVVEKHLMVDMCKSVKPWVIQILNNNYKVMIYNGQLDVIIALPLTEAFLRDLEWKYQGEYLTADRHIWRVDKKDVEVAGYVRRVRNLYQVLVRTGGHILPFDQPRRSFDMLDRFITERPFF